MRDSITYENEFWLFFGHGKDWPEDKCSLCYKLLESTKKPNPHSINCWKLEIFFSNCTDIDGVKNYFLEEARRDPSLHGKWLKKKMDVPRKILTSIPEEGHPDKDVKKEGVLLIYTQSIAERESRRKKILNDLHERKLYKKNNISYRRGCVNFDEVIGSWKTWYDLNKDYEE